MRRLKTRNILVATGGRAVKPNIPGVVSEGVCCCDLRASVEP